MYFCSILIVFSRKKSFSFPFYVTISIWIRWKWVISLLIVVFGFTPQATCVQYRLVVRDVSTLQIMHLYTCLDQISHMEWSSDSLFILCAMYKRGLVQVG